MNIEIIRAIILFAIGDASFRAQLVEDPEAATAQYGLGVDERLLLSTVQFDGPIAFTDEQLLEQLLGSAKTGWEAFGGFAAASGLAVPDRVPDVDLADFFAGANFDLLGPLDFGLPRIDDPSAFADALDYELNYSAEADDLDSPVDPDAPPNP
jgi:hypothetical protein